MGVILSILARAVIDGLRDSLAENPPDGVTLRRFVASKLRLVAVGVSDRIEAGDVVSDEALDKLRDALERVRKLQSKAK